MAKNLISFRLDPAHLELLRKQAGPGMSASTYARELVLRGLHGDAVNGAVHQRLGAVEETQSKLRRDIRLLLEGIFALSSRRSLDEVRTMVRRILR